MGSSSVAGKPKNNSLISFVSGGIAGVTAKSAVAPLERVKILYQIKSQLYSLDGIFSSLAKIVKNEGIKGLWRGNTATIARVFPYASVQFLTFETLKSNIVHTPLNLFCAGSTAGGMAVLSTNEGIRGMYRGIQPTLLGILPYGGISFSTFETLKKHAPQRFRNENGSLVDIYKFCIGGFSGGLAQTVSYPLDVIRRRMQTKGYGDGRVEINLNHSTLRSMYIIAKNEGFLSLYKGLSINYIKVVPTSSIAFYTYELVSSLLHRF
eukprot:gene5859-7288_t